MKGQIIYIEGIKRFLASQEGIDKVVAFLTRDRKLAFKQFIRKGDDELVAVCKVIFDDELNIEEIKDTINDILLMN